MDKVTIVKLGGSAITDKSRKCTPDIPVIQHVVDQIAEYDLPLVLVHGGGSYAHPFVTQSGLNRGLSDHSQLRSVSETEFYLGQLTRIICASLLLRDRFPVPLHPMSFAVLDNGNARKVHLAPIRKSLLTGLIPLLHGDLVFDESRGITVLSGDRLISMIAPELGTSRVLFGCDVDGVYTENPKTSSKATPIPEVTVKNFREVLRASRGTSQDATGGMQEKVKRALDLAKNGFECYIFDLRRKNALRSLLRRNDTSGTRFVPWTRPRTSGRQSSRTM